MKLTDSLPFKKSLVILGLYTLLLIFAGYILRDYLFPIPDQNLSAAAAGYKRELKKNPNDSEAHARLGWVYYQIATEEKNSSFLQKAEKEYRQAIGLSPNNVGYRYNLGLTLEEMGQIKQAQEQYLKIVQIEPNHELANYNLGTLYYKSGSYEQAVKHYKKVLEAEPTAGNVYYETGRAYEDLQDKQNAIAMYQFALKYTPDIADAKHRIQLLSGNGK